jgi:hypothetical protein
MKTIETRVRQLLWLAAAAIAIISAVLGLFVVEAS